MWANPWLRALDRCGSTNDELRRWASQGAPHGAAITARSQEVGRGRSGKRWHSPEGEGLYLSVLLRPDIDAALAPGLSFVAGLACAEALDAFLPSPTALKWPNDLYTNGKKLGGLLLEMSAAPSGRCEFVIVGVGVNVGTREFPEEIREVATSLALANPGAKVPDLESLRDALIGSLRAHAARFVRDGVAPALAAWRARSFTIGKRVEVQQPSGPIRGLAVGIDDQGALLVETSPGVVVPVIAGDLLHLL
jgi:BirA family biotin operon repressor/biotin-[acetyl-CoA-carboxylase] ligase